MSQSQTFVKLMYADQASAYATAATPDTVIPRVQRFTPINSNGFVYDRGVGEGLNVVSTYFGPWTSGGTVDFSVVDFNFLEHWVGQKTGAGSVGDPYTLTEASRIEAAASAAGRLQPFTLEVNNDYETTPTVTTYVGCVGDSFVLDASLGGKLECTANFVARHSVPDTSATSYTANTGNSFIMINGTWKWGATPTALSGVRAFRMEYTNTLITDTRSLDSRFIGIPVYGQRSYKFSVDIVMASALSTTVLADFYGSASGNAPNDGSSSSTPTADLEFKVELVNGAKYANLWFDQCSIDDISKPQALGGGIVVLTFNGTAQKGKSNAPITWWDV